MKNGCPMSSFASKNALVYNVLMAVRVLRVLHWFIFKIHSYIYVLTKSSNIFFGYASHVLWVAYNIFWINDVQAWLHSSDPCWVCWCGSAQHYGLISIKRCNSNWKNSTVPFFEHNWKNFKLDTYSVFVGIALRHGLTLRKKIIRNMYIRYYVYQIIILTGAHLTSPTCHGTGWFFGLEAS